MTINSVVSSVCTLLGIWIAINLLFLQWDWVAYGVGCWIIGYYLFLFLQEYEHKKENEEDY